MSDPREYALAALKKSLMQRSFLSLALENIAPDEHAAFINMLCLTAARRMTDILNILKKHVKKLPSPRQDVRYALILGAAELLYMNTPDYAAINSYVNISKKLSGKYAAGMVNAVLRSICRQKEELRAQPQHFFPAPFLTMLKQDYSPENVAKIEQAAGREPPLTISVKSNASFWAQKLGGNAISEKSLCLNNAGKITRLEGYDEGEWWIQDFAASLAATVLAPKPGTKVLDLCAAPGGKTAQLLNAGADVTALDISADRLQILQKNITRLRLPLPEIVCQNAVDYLCACPQEKFDAILLDAPCSATGIFRRHPELVWFKDKKDVITQTALQKQILEACPLALKNGGYLVYSVCSIAKAEGERQIRSFLSAFPEFRLVPLTEKDISADTLPCFKELITKDGFIRTLPYMLSEYGGLDSFFIAKLQKVK